MDLIKRAGLSVLGVAVTLGWWTLRGAPDDEGESVAEVPEVVWEGGDEVVVETSCTEPGKLHLSFRREGPDGEDGPDQTLDVNASVPAGDQRFSLRVPPGVSGYVELSIDNPQVGAKVGVRVHASGKLAGEDQGELDRPLQEGYAFFAQLYMNDYAAGELGDD